jgi:hypothetical protein
MDETHITKTQSVISPQNWSVRRKRDGRIYVRHFTATTRDDATHYGRSSISRHISGTKSPLKESEVCITKAAMNKAGIWFVADCDGKVYKLLFGNMYSNKKFPCQTADEVTTILRHLQD